MSDFPPPGEPNDQQPPSYPGQQPYAGQQPYLGQGQQPGYQQPTNAMPPSHPKATTVLVLGILGLVLCQVLSPFAWIMGNRAVAEIDANPQAYSGRSEANAGRICGIIGTVILVLWVVALAFFAFLVIASVSTVSNSDYDQLSLISLF